MNKAETEYAIQVMQAWLDGRQIQVDDFSNEHWEDIKAPHWQWGTRTYRIKPEPREFWLVGSNVYNSKEIAYKLHLTTPIHVREVLEE